MRGVAAGRWTGIGVVLVLAAAVGLASGLGGSGTMGPGESAGAGQTDRPSSGPTFPDAGVAGCGVTPDAPAAATIGIANRAFDEPVTVEAGQAVAFVSHDNTAHTITEGIGGHADEHACVRHRLPPFGSTTVTFLARGDYAITCTIHASMQTVVHVR